MGIRRGFDESVCFFAARVESRRRRPSRGFRASPRAHRKRRLTIDKKNYASLHALRSLSAACAAASLAMGTRKGEHET
jgi:hypothetical protein